MPYREMQRYGTFTSLGHCLVRLHVIITYVHFLNEVYCNEQTVRDIRKRYSVEWKIWYSMHRTISHGALCFLQLYHSSTNLKWHSRQLDTCRMFNILSPLYSVIILNSRWIQCVIIYASRKSDHFLIPMGRTDFFFSVSEQNNKIVYFLRFRVIVYFLSHTVHCL